jgi:hypothetical protein
LPSSEPDIGGLFTMYKEPEDAIANELDAGWMNVDEPDTTKLLPVTVKTLPE